MNELLEAPHHAMVLTVPEGGMCRRGREQVGTLGWYFLRCSVLPAEATGRRKGLVGSAGHYSLFHGCGSCCLSLSLSFFSGKWE